MFILRRSYKTGYPWYRKSRLYQTPFVWVGAVFGPDVIYDLSDNDQAISINAMPFYPPPAVCDLDFEKNVPHIAAKDVFLMAASPCSW
jgi:hypothetical protein